MPPRHRSAPTPQARDRLAAVEPPPPAGHNSEATDDALIAENFRIEEQIKAASAKLDEWAAPHKARIKEIEDQLFARLTERKADSTKTDSGTAYISTVGSVKIEDQEKLFDFAADNWEAFKGEIKLAIGIKAVRRYMEEHEGNEPPGTKLSNFNRLNINRS